MTHAAAVHYDENFSVEIHEHRPRLVKSEGDELRCEVCGGALKIVCVKDSSHDPLEAVRASKGPVPSAPAYEPRRRKTIPNEKHCGGCDTVKPSSEFYKKNGRPIWRCKTCWSKYLKDRKDKKAAE